MSYDFFLSWLLMQLIHELFVSRLSALFNSLYCGCSAAAETLLPSAVALLKMKRNQIQQLHHWNI